MNRRAFSLVEVLIAAVVMAGLGGALMTVISGNSQVSARAGEMQMASLVGSRVMDRLLALEYKGLRDRLKLKGPEEAIDLAAMPVGDVAPGPDGASEAAAPTDNQLVVDGFAFTAKSRLSEPKPGLLAVSLKVSWQRFGTTTTPKEPGQLSLVRLVGDPLSAMAGEVR